MLLPAATKLGQGNIFTSVCQEFCPQGGCLPQCMLGYPPRSRPPRDQAPPPGADPQEQTPPPGTRPTPRSRHPPGTRPTPRDQTPSPQEAYGQRAAGTHPTGIHSCFVSVQSKTRGNVLKPCFGSNTLTVTLHLNSGALLFCDNLQ